MRIGSHTLNEDQAKWAREFAENIANQAKKEAVSKLNAKLEIGDLKEFLAWYWIKAPKPEPVAEEEPVSEDPIFIEKEKSEE
jgi:hypothetical protein